MVQAKYFSIHAPPEVQNRFVRQRSAAGRVGGVNRVGGVSHSLMSARQGRPYIKTESEMYSIIVLLWWCINSVFFK